MSSWVIHLFHVASTELIWWYQLKVPGLVGLYHIWHLGRDTGWLDSSETLT